MSEQTGASVSHTEYLIAAEALPALADKIAKLSRRAAKLGLAAPAMIDGGHVASRRVWGRDENGRRVEPAHIVRLHAVTIVGERPVLGGWRFVACLHHIDGATLMLGTGEAVPARFRDAESACDHCCVTRRRNDTYVLAHEDGRYVQIGRSCIQDFLAGRTSVASMAAMAEILSEMIGFAESAEADDWSEKSPRGVRCYPLETWLTWCAVAIRLDHGYVSKKAAHEGRPSTSGRAYSFMFPCRDERPPSIEGRDREAARAVVAWAEDLSDEQVEADYLHNLRAIARTGYVEGRTMGLAASMCIARDRSIIQQRPARPVSQHFGTVGERTKKGAEYVLTVDRIIPIESDYGTSYLHIMSDASGNIAKWKASGSVLEKGETYRVAATVKAHEEYSGTAQTVLTRCKAQKVEPAAQAA